jgi:Uma2 family endonuclease
MAINDMAVLEREAAAKEDQAWITQTKRMRAAHVRYPESDGEPMAETDVHREQMLYLIEALKDYYRDRARNRDDVYVAGNLFVYYEEGNPQAVLAPDVFVVFGVPDEHRRTYKVWEEGQTPDVVFEITSTSTKAEDLGSKKGVYAYLGVKEYFLYDPLGDYLRPAFQGYALDEAVRLGVYRPIPSDEEGVLHSRQLGLTLRVEEDLLRLYDPATGEKLLTPQEAQAARRAAEARVAELEAELARLRGSE